MKAKTKTIRLPSSLAEAMQDEINSGRKLAALMESEVAVRLARLDALSANTNEEFAKFRRSKRRSPYGERKR